MLQIAKGSYKGQGSEEAGFEQMMFRGLQVPMELSPTQFDMDWNHSYKNILTTQISKDEHPLTGLEINNFDR